MCQTAQMGKFAAEHGGVAFGMAVIPVNSSKLVAAKNLKLDPAQTKVMLPVWEPSDTAAKQELQQHYPGMLAFDICSLNP